MKSNFNIAAIAITLVMTTTLFSSCKKSTPPISDAEAASIVSSTASNSSGGLAYDIAQAITYPAQYGKKGGVNRIQGLNCNTPESNPISWSDSASGASGYNFSYNGNSTYELNCNAGNPSSFSVIDGYNGQYSFGTTFSGSTSDSSNWTITQLDSSFSAYIFNGLFNISGNYKSTSGGKTSSYSFSLGYTVTNLTVDKSTQYITGGTAVIKVNASIDGGSNYSASGNIVFHNDNTATITLGSYTGTISTI